MKEWSNQSIKNLLQCSFKEILGSYRVNKSYRPGYKIQSHGHSMWFGKILHTIGSMSLSLSNGMHNASKNMYSRNICN